MYLHLGEDVVVSFADVIGVFDLDNTSVSAITRDFLARTQKTPGRVVNVSYGLPKSFILCQEKKGPLRLYISQISSATLLRRANDFLENLR